jgi:hypothetical protein
MYLPCCFVAKIEREDNISEAPSTMPSIVVQPFFFFLHSSTHPYAQTTSKKEKQSSVLNTLCNETGKLHSQIYWNQFYLFV